MSSWIVLLLPWPASDLCWMAKWRIAFLHEFVFQRSSPPALPTIADLVTRSLPSPPATTATSPIQREDIRTLTTSNYK